MKVNEIAFTAYPVTDVKRACKFYEGVLGLVQSRKFEEKTMSWIEYDLGASTLAIGAGAPGFTPSSAGGFVGLEVEDFPTAVAALKKAGSKFTLEPFETPVCHMACVLDPDGNSVMIHKRKPGHS